MSFISRETSRQTGVKYEQKAADYLKSIGYEIIEMNYHSKHGEIDIIAVHESYIVFVEVKYRKDNFTGYPYEAVGVKKQKRIKYTAWMYLLKNGYNPEQVRCRFDVVSILSDDITLYTNAF